MKVLYAYIEFSGVIGNWQAVRTDNRIEFCVRLDSLPGSVKCVTTKHDGYGVFKDNVNSVELYRNGRFEDLDPPLEGLTSSSPVALWLFGGQNHSDYQGADRVCHLFDEGPKIFGPKKCETREEWIRCDFGNPHPDCREGNEKLVPVTHCYRDEI